MRTRLIGRDVELELVAGRLRSGRSVLLAGVSGVGKTRLSQEALDLLAADGIPVRRALDPPGALDHVRETVRSLHGSVVFVDDAHMLDDASAALVHQAAAAGITILTTIRTGAHIPEAVTALWKDGLAERIELQALARADVELLLAEALGGDASGETAAAICTAARGNPSLVLEIVAGSIRTGALRDDGGVWRLTGRMPVPANVAEPVAGLDPDALAAYETLAAAGELGVRSLEVLCGAGPVAALDDAGLIEIVADGGRRLARLAHPMLAELVRDRPPARVLVERRRALAAELHRCGLRRADDAVRAAVWLLDADGTAPAELLLRAAGAVHRDPALGVRLARAALDAGAGKSAALLLGGALAASGRPGDAEEVLRGIRTDDDTIRERVVSARACNLAIGLRRFDDARALLDDRSMAGDLVQETRATIELFAGRLADADAAVRGLGHSSAASMVAALNGRCTRALELTSAGAPSEPRIVALLALGRLEEAERAAGDGYHGGLDHRDGRSVGTHALLLGRIALLRGHVRTAARWFREAAAADRARGDAVSLRWSLGGLAAALGMSGDAAGSEAAVVELDAIGAGGVLLLEPDPVGLGRAWTAAAAGRLDDARGELERAVRLARDTGQAVLEAVLLHEHRRLRGSGDDAREPELAATIGGGLLAAWTAPADARSQMDAAERLLAIGADLDAAETALRAAAAARVEGHRRVGEAAARLAADASGRCEGVRTPALERPIEVVPLSRREREVATLAASGLTNQEIADRLVLSVRTVENHLQRAYDKLGVRGRDEL